MRYWLMKSEPSELSIDSLAAEPQRLFEWTGVRNYQARNFMRDEMREGDRLLFWHSSCPAPGVAGLAEIVVPAYPDPTQFDPGSLYYDQKSASSAPRWLAVDVRFLRKTRLLNLAELRQHPLLLNMTVLKRGNRLSISSLSENEWRYITEELLAC